MGRLQRDFSVNREDVFFFVIDVPMTIDKLMSLLYAAPSAATRKHFLHVNGHINPANLRPGQLVVVTPAEPTQCTELEAQFAQMAQDLDNVRQQVNVPDAEAAKVLSQHYDLLSFAEANASGAVGTFATTYGVRVKHVAQILREIELLYVNTYNRYGSLNDQSFYAQRAAKFRQLDAALGSLVRGNVLDSGNARMKRALGLSTKSAVHHWRRQNGAAHSLPGFEKHHQRVGRLATRLKWLGYVGIGLDGYYSYSQIQEACTSGNSDPACTKRKFTEGGRFAGSTVGGAAGGFASAYGVCNLILGLPSGGTSLLWCGILAGGGGALLGGSLGAKGGQEAGEMVYEKTYGLPR